MNQRFRYQFYRPNVVMLNRYEKRFWGDDEEKTTTQTSTPQFYAAPEYAEATGARQKTWSTLQDWGNQPGYGIIEPNYENIYNNAKKRINEHYFGSALNGGGVAGQIDASLAKRGMADSPASSIMRGRMGAEQGSQLMDVSTQQDIARAQAGEQARTNWLASMQNLSNMKPAGTWGGTTTTTAPDNSSGDMWGAVGTGVGTVLGNTVFAPYGGSVWGSMVGGALGKTIGGSTGTTQSSISDVDWNEKTKKQNETSGWGMI